jgi:branched-chain amino acid transport system substrate-binding protein
MLGAGLTSTKGDVTKKADFSAALLKARIDSPRGPFTISASHNPVQDIYLRQVDGEENKLVGVASKSLADPGRGCRLQGS